MYLRKRDLHRYKLQMDFSVILNIVWEAQSHLGNIDHKSINSLLPLEARWVALHMIWESEPEFSHGIVILKIPLRFKIATRAGNVTVLKKKKNPPVLGRWTETPVCSWNKPTLTPEERQVTYPRTHASATRGDFEIPVEILDGPSREETFHHQQNAVHKECSSNAIDHILEDVNPGKKRWSGLV